MVRRAAGPAITSGESPQGDRVLTAPHARQRLIRPGDIGAAPPMQLAKAEPTTFPGSPEAEPEARPGESIWRSPTARIGSRRSIDAADRLLGVAAAPPTGESRLDMELLSSDIDLVANRVIDSQLIVPVRTFLLATIRKLHGDLAAHASAFAGFDAHGDYLLVADHAAASLPALAFAGAGTFPAALHAESAWHAGYAAAQSPALSGAHPPAAAQPIGSRRSMISATALGTETLHRFESPSTLAAARTAAAPPAAAPQIPAGGGDQSSYASSAKVFAGGPWSALHAPAIRVAPEIGDDPRARSAQPATPAGASSQTKTVDLYGRPATRAMALPAVATLEQSFKKKMASALAVQRVAMGQSATGMGGRSVQPEHGGNVTSGEKGAEASDVSLLANEVWTHLKRRLRIEAERLGNRK
jgi:hypothetical protein